VHRSQVKEKSEVNQNNNNRKKTLF